MEIAIQPTDRSTPKTVKELANWLRYVADHLDTIPDVPLLLIPEYYEVGMQYDENNKLFGLYLVIESLVNNSQDIKKKFVLVPPDERD